MNPLALKLEEFVRFHHLIHSKQTVLLAVSGGIDSMVMLHIFSILRKRFDLQIAIVHVNHQLRGKESMEDELFVREMSAAYGFYFYCERVKVVPYADEHGLSKQIAARQLRYACFERIRQHAEAQAVATAHHADDNAETVLLNILRGTGIHGLAGIPLQREAGRIIRPLLFATRKEIELYARENDIKFRNDSSNVSLAYRRNLLRHSILPPLVNRVPHLVDTLNIVAATMRDVSQKLDAMVEEALSSLSHKDPQDRLLLDVKKLTMMPDFLWDEIVVELLHRMHIEPTEKKVDALHKLCTMPTGRIVELSGELSACRDRGHIVFQRTTKDLSMVRQVKFGGSYVYQGCLISISNPEPVPAVFSDTQEAEYIDAERLGRQLVLRPWQRGDWFIPLGMKTKKKLSDYFTDQKVPRFQKSSIPVLESDGAIVWICGKRLDNRFKLTEHTRTAIRLTYHSST
jgi:tRNA(Ile)-lysidine synthase